MQGHGHDESVPTPNGMNVGRFGSVCGVFRERSLGVHRTFATYWFSVCYILIIQKHGFCNAKVWFLACKKGVFAMQEVGFWNSNTGLLQNVDVQIMGYNSMVGYLFRGLNNCN